MIRRIITICLMIFLFVLFIPQKSSASLKFNRIIISPKLGIQHFHDDIMSEYYERELALSWGLDLELLTDFYQIGLFAKFKMMKFTIPNERENYPIENDEYWFSFGIEKAMTLNTFIFTPMIGYTLRIPKYFDSIQSQTNLHTNLNIKMKINTHFGITADLGYEYSKVQQVYWVHCEWGRDLMLSGQQYERGGFFINMGVFFCFQKSKSDR